MSCFTYTCRRYYSSYKAIKLGKPFTAAHRVFIENNKGQVISPFHDIPLYSSKETVNMVVEIPRWTNAKIEIATGEKFNPIKQDSKKGKMRFVRNCFPYKGYIWNYGALPQTWEDPTVIHHETMAKGDNDPVDVIEIGQEIAKVGQVKEVKVLGVMAMLDEGETDWKVLAIDKNDPNASKLNGKNRYTPEKMDTYCFVVDVEDVEKLYPGLIDATREWFRVYKIPDGKPANTFAFDGQCKNRAYANSVIQETHEAWKKLIDGQIPPKAETHDLSVENVCVEGSPYKTESIVVKPENFEQEFEKNVPEYDGKWYYI
ncbi:inorganic pyrophosphatase [Backusella circina FSU 941]|nr:inorganic pyrophosphatase [Backusella circina FSU 941]